LYQNLSPSPVIIFSFRIYRIQKDHQRSSEIQDFEKKKKRTPSDIDMRRILLIAGEGEVWGSGGRGGGKKRVEK